MNKELRYSFITHVCKYLGIALVSGSIVHAGTLGGSSVKYIGLIIIGIFLTVLGNYLEYKIKNIKVGVNIFLLAILLSFGTGMLSGGIQHYTDNPAYGSVLLSLGLIITFISLAYKDFAKVVSKKSILIIFAISIILYFALSFVGHNFVSESANDNHHSMAPGMKMGHGNIKVESDMEMGSMSMDNMIDMMQGKTGKALEKEFLTGMIPHHKGAVEMAKLLLKDKTVDPEIRAFAENIIKAQDSEILVMNKWLKNY